jgi:hypothetical protein
MNHVLRIVAAAVVGVFAWFAVATAVNLLFRARWPGYAGAEPGLAFTVAMMIGRLVLGVASGVVAGLVAAWIVRRGDAGAYALSAALLVLFVPEHVQLWSRFPAWYHATFLASLLVAPWVGGRQLGGRATVAPHDASSVEYPERIS